MSKYFFISSLLQRCKRENYTKILNIGPSNIFSIASHSIKDIKNLRDFKRIKDFTSLDVKFDFIYIQSESMENLKINEFEDTFEDINKLCNRGCIETLSPSQSSFFIKGNVITWTDFNTNYINILRLESKYHDPTLTMNIVNNYTNNQIFYHNFYLWNLPINDKMNKINKTKSIQYNILSPKTKEEYLQLLYKGISTSITNTELLMKNFQ